MGLIARSFSPIFRSLGKNGRLNSETSREGFLCNRFDVTDLLHEHKSVTPKPLREILAITNKRRLLQNAEERSANKNNVAVI